LPRKGIKRRVGGRVPQYSFTNREVKALGGGGRPERKKNCAVNREKTEK